MVLSHLEVRAALAQGAEAMRIQVVTRLEELGETRLAEVVRLMRIA